MYSPKIFEFEGERVHGFHALEIPCILIIRHINIKAVLPFVTDDGERLNFGEIDFVEAEDTQHACQCALFVRQCENECGLVAQCDTEHSIVPFAAAHHQESGEVVLIVLNASLQQLETIPSCGIGVTDGRVSVPLFASDVSRRAGCVVGFHALS